MYYEETVTSSVIRLYDVPNGFKDQSAYVGTITVNYLTPTIVWLSNLLSVVGIERKDIDWVKGMLRTKGVVSMSYLRSGVVVEEVL